MSALLVLLVVLAVWRVARLLTIDYLAEPYRTWMEARHPKLGYLAQCPWCTSVWVAPLLAWPALWWPDNRAVWLVLLSLAASLIAGFGSTVEGWIDAYTAWAEHSE